MSVYVLTTLIDYTKAFNLVIIFTQIAQLVEDVHRLQATVNKLRDSGSSQVHTKSSNFKLAA